MRATSAIVRCFFIAALYQAPGMQIADIHAAAGRLFLKSSIPKNHKRDSIPATDNARKDEAQAQ